MASKKLGYPEAPPNEARPCVLVVEDELLIRMLLSEGLRDEGFQVIEACNADEALMILDTGQTDIIISDVRMPGALDGLGLLRLVRQRFAALPVIVTSGHLEPREALNEGASRFVTKPYTVEDVIYEVRQVLGTAK